MTPEEFLADEGVRGWRVEDGQAVGTFATGSFSAGAEFVSEVAEAADAANHHPDVQLTYPSVTFSLITHDAGGVLTDLDLQLAREISDIAVRRGHDVTTE